MVDDGSTFDIHVHGIRIKFLVVQNELRHGEDVLLVQDASVSIIRRVASQFVVESFEEFRDVALAGRDAVLFFYDQILQGKRAGGRPLGHEGGVVDGTAEF
jgi:hypothetical protein